jgi:hypothetical protein
VLDIVTQNAICAGYTPAPETRRCGFARLLGFRGQFRGQTGLPLSPVNPMGGTDGKLSLQ